MGFRKSNSAQAALAAPYIYVYSERAKEKILKMENAVAIKDRIQVMPSMFP